MRSPGKQLDHSCAPDRALLGQSLAARFVELDLAQRIAAVDE
jgi:hypothetical protein